MKRELTADRLRELLSYAPETGVFTWLVSRGRAKAGDVAGTNDGQGYIVIRIDGRNYLAHRLAWLYTHGRWPAEQIDHRNGVRSVNRLANLREASRSVNMQNRRSAHSNNQVGLLGVRRYRNRFEARIYIDGKMRRLGSFATPELAHAAYVDAKRELHPGNTL